ncbi:MAG: hypothetical protein ABI191_08130 [Rhizomicrobium sp.]
MKRFLAIVVLVAAFAVTIAVTSYIARLPESDCVTEPLSQAWSGDHLYQATLLRKNCRRGEYFSYSVRVDKPNTPTGGWFIIDAIERDGEKNPVPPPPTINWTAHRLDIETQSSTLSGSVEHREGDLLLVRSYIRPKS